MICPLEEKRWAMLVGETNQAERIRRRTGADDESARSDPAGHGREVEVDGCGGGAGHYRSQPATVARALSRVRLRRSIRPSQRRAQPEAGTGPDGGTGTRLVPGAVSRLQRAALPREAGRTTWRPTQLYLGQAGAARGGAGA